MALTPRLRVRMPAPALRGAAALALTSMPTGWTRCALSLLLARSLRSMPAR